ncbi:hypothetical protein F4808DRAFT_439103 [Astrocystis sublimbata]|nr:hypothetical protein F4808DRAFT_439103 [Astrocystis sublimbata]
MVLLNVRIVLVLTITTCTLVGGDPRACGARRGYGVTGRNVSPTRGHPPLSLPPTSSKRAMSEILHTCTYLHIGCLSRRGCLEVLRMRPVSLANNLRTSTVLTYCTYKPTSRDGAIPLA